MLFYKWLIHVTMGRQEQRCHCCVLQRLRAIERRFRHAKLSIFHPNSCLPAIDVYRPVRHRLPLPLHKEITYFKRILQKQPKLLPFGTSPAYDIVMLNTLNYNIYLYTHTFCWRELEPRHTRKIKYVLESNKKFIYVSYLKRRRGISKLKCALLLITFW